MARPRQVMPKPPNGFIASATRMPSVQRNRAVGAEGWMGEAWANYDCVGELRFISNWVGNVMSRARLRAMHRVGDSYEIVEQGPVFEALESYFGGVSGQAQMLQATGVNLTVTGEAYHVMVGDTEDWYVLSSGTVSQSLDTVWATVAGERIEISRNDLAIRVWSPHPQRVEMADSPVRSNMGTLQEIRRLNDHVSAQLDSRLAGAGILFMPSEVQFAGADNTDPQANQADAFLSILSETMMTPIRDRSSAAAVVPLIVTIPGEMLDKVQHLTFWSPLDENTITMRDNAVKRLALGMDTPPEVLLGLGDSTQWSSWAVDESAIKSHLEPRLSVVAHAITTAYLRPAIIDEVPDPENYVVMADTSAIRMRPNRSNEAIELYDRGELTGEALRRETGFANADAPDEMETIQWLLRKVATGSTSPEQTVAALRKLGADLGLSSTPSSSGTNKPPPDDLRTDTDWRRLRSPDKRAPDMDRAISRTDTRAAGLVPACEVLVMRALERAGNKLCDSKARSNGLGKLPAHRRYLEASGSNDVLLEGTWEFASEMLPRLTDNPDAVMSVLDIYVRGLLTAQMEHTTEGLVAALSKLEVEHV